MERTPRVFDGLPEVEAADPAVVAAHLFVRSFGDGLTRSQTKLNWYPVVRHLSRLGGFDSELRFFSGGRISMQANMIVLESVLLWESASLAGRAIQELWLLRAGQMALTSIDPFEATLSALRHGRTQPGD